MNATLPSRSVNRMQPLTPAEQNLRRRLILQDTLALLSLTLITVVIAVLTYFFFRSFRQHRSVLEERWYQRGQKALLAGDPQAAVRDFRSALALSAANPTYELSLAEALAAANRNNEAWAYFSSLHDAQPGDGFLNLQLARLAVKRNDSRQAIDLYRNALSGLWYGQGAAQRFQIRLELARYLMSLGENTQAQGDLLTAEGNSLDHPAELLQVADLLSQAGDAPDAAATYHRVEIHPAAKPAQALRALIGQAQAYAQAGQYKRADEALERYEGRLRQHPDASSPDEKRTAQQQLAQLQRMLALIPFSALPPKPHAERVLLGAGIAHRRYTHCAAQFQPPNGSDDALTPNDAAALTNLGDQWTAFGPLTTSKLVEDAALQQNLANWTARTEILMAKICGAPTGDDAALLQLARVPDKGE